MMHFLQHAYKLKLFSLMAVMLVLSTIAVGQSSVSVSGKVTDDTGEGLPGATVQVEGTNNGTVTDVDGNFRLSSPSNATLIFSFIGYQTISEAIAGRSVIDIQLEAEASELDEIVVVGYGSQKRSDLTGSIASVGADDIALMPVNSVDQALQGRVPGLNLTNTSGAPGAGVSIRIRGSNSILGSSEPLYVVDGVPYFNDNGGAGAGALTGDQGSSETEVEDFNVLASLNPNDIESIEVLKDASATAIYGSRGANGVIIITTKKGAEGTGRFKYGTWFGFSSVINAPDMLDANGYAAYRNEQFRLNQENPDSVAQEDLPFPGIERETEDGTGTFFSPGPGDFDYSTDWLDEISQSGITQSHNLSFSGGTKDTRYYLSGEYFTQDGIILASGMERISGRLNLNHNFSSKLKLNANIFYSQINSDNQATATGNIDENIGAVSRAIGWAPTNLVYNDDGTFWTNPDPTADPVDAFISPVSQILGTDVLRDISQLNTTLSLDYTIIDGLTFTTRLGYFAYSSRRQTFYGEGSWLGNNNNGIGLSNSNLTRKPNWDNFINYVKTFDRHNVNVTLGTSWEERVRTAEGASSRDFAIDALGFNALQAGAIQGIPFTNKDVNTLSSYYARANYIFNDKYLFTFTGRADGSSVFAENQKWGFFPSVAFAWRASEESFIQNLSAVSNLKVRVSYGQSGNQAINPYQSLATLRFSNYNQNGQLVTGLVPSTLANPDLSWETTTQFNIGFDLGTLDNRLRFTADYYNKSTTDLLWLVNLPTASGFSNALSNLGEVENKGFEFSLQADLITTGDFRLSVSGNIATNTNTLLDLGDETTIPGPSLRGGPNFPVHVLEVGQPLNSFWVYEEDGYISEEDIENGVALLGGQGAGDIKYVDQNGDSLISDLDRKIFGNPVPEITFGFGLNASFKGLALDVLFTGVSGVDVYNVTRQSATAIGNRAGWNKVADYNDNYWTPDNQDAKYPSIGSTANWSPSERFVEDASFLRLANVRLAYDFGAIVNNTSWLSELQVYVTGRNLLTLTDYSGFDPEVSAFGQNPTLPSVDYGGYPQVRTYVVGLNLGF
ncbi:MAG: TonB-dependent receptor [Cyclobacteriaceae bacterium]